VKRCIYCHKVIWPWQGHLFTFHKACLEIYCQGYAQGVKIAAEQAVKIMAEIQRHFATPQQRETMQ